MPPMVTGSNSSSTQARFAGLFLSGQFGWGPTWLHLWFGYALLGVLIFRVCWGFVGSDSARWATLMPSPGQIVAYLPLLFSRRPSHWPGHNPIGALSTLALIGLLLVQSVSGLFIETWGDVRGPLAERVPRPWMLLMSDLHSALRWPLLGLAVVHSLAAFAYLACKRENRIGSIFGNGALALKDDPMLSIRGGVRAWAVWLSAAAAVAAIVRLGPVA